MIELTDEHLALARRMAKSYGVRQGWPHLIDEFESAAMLALSQAAANYDDSDVPFTAWASIQIRGRIIDAHRSWIGRHHGMHPHAGSMELGELLDQVNVLEPRREHVEHEVDCRETLAEVLALVDELPDRERLVVLATANGRTQAELATVLGVTESRVSQILTAGREHLARLVAGEPASELFRRKRPSCVSSERARLELELLARHVDRPGRVGVAAPHPADPGDLDVGVVGGHLDHVPPAPSGRPVPAHHLQLAEAV